MNRNKPLADAQMEFRAGVWNGHTVKTAWTKETDTYRVIVDDLPAVDVKGDLDLARYLKDKVQPKLLGGGK